MTTTRLTLGLAALFSTLLLTGCGPSWKVLRASGPPSALAAAKDVAVAYDYSQMQVEGRPEQEWVATKTAQEPNYPTTWTDLKAKFEGAVLEGLQKEYPSAHTAQVGVDSVVMVVQVQKFKMGKFIPFVLPPTVIEASLIWQVGGQPTDEISLVRQFPSSIYNPSVFTHIGPVGQAIGHAGGKYLAQTQGR
ncbi:MAG TPA: hypothetical protein VGK67_00815 [Myxococcales bacterium]